MLEAITAAVGRDVTVVASAGNYNASTGPAFPASCPGVIAVAASDPSDAVPDYSNRGIGIDLAAPGGSFSGFAGWGASLAPCDGITTSNTGGVASTWTQPNGVHCYRQGAGTSFAAPHVSGVIALLRSLRSNLGPAQIRAILRLTANRGFTCASNACGAGRLDARAAVEAVAPGSFAALASVSPGGINFGTVVGATVKTVELSNVGFGDPLSRTAPMQLEGTSNWFHFGGTCSGVSCNQPYTLFTGASITTDVVCEPTSNGTRTAEFVYNHTGVGQARVQLSCTSSNGVRVLTAPTTLAIGNVEVGTTRGESFLLRNTGTSALSITSSSIDHAAFSLAAPLPAIISANSSVNVVVQCTPPAVASCVGSITINSTGGNRTIALTCTGAVPVLSAPSTVAFGPVRVGTDLNRSLAITNAGGVPLTITAASLDPEPGFKVISALPITVAAGATSNLVLRCTPPSEGLIENTLQLDGNAGTTYVGLSCSGVAPRLSVSPSTVYFDFVAVGTTRTRNVTIRNTGSGPLSVTHVFASGGAFAVTTLAVVLPPGTSTTLAVRCTPFTAGTTTGYLGVQSDVSGLPRYLNLVCQGATPQLEAPASLTLPNAPVGGASTATLELSNPGDVPVTITSATVIGQADLSIVGVPSTIPPGELASVTVRCAPTATGDLVGIVQLEIEGGSPTSTEVQCRAVAAGGGEIEIPIEIDPIGPIWPPPGTETETE